MVNNKFLKAQKHNCYGNWKLSDSVMKEFCLQITFYLREILFK